MVIYTVTKTNADHTNEDT